MPVDSTSTSALAFANVQVDPNILSKYTNAVAIHSAQHNKGWLYRIECRDPRAYDEFNEALTATEIHLKSRCFLPVLDDGGCTNGKIVLNPPKDAFLPTSVWRQPLSTQNENDLLIPGLKRLSKQLKVDFATNVHGSEGKRRREQTRTIYDEDAAPGGKKQTKVRAAAKTADEESYSFAEKALDAVNTSHAEVVDAKDETIRALTSALAMKEELVRTQASLITLLQRGSAHSP
jgi:hypothetical protein